MTTIQKGPLLATGRTAEIFAWGEDQALKLLYDRRPKAVEHEARVAQFAYNSGAPTPRCYGVVEVEGQPGILYERVRGRSMLSAISAQPWRLWTFAYTLAELHAAIHCCSAPPEVRAVRPAVAQGIAQAKALPAALKETAQQALARLPDGDRLCHGDFHPGNVMLTAQGPVIIDWVDMARGDPLADVAQTGILLQCGGLPADLSAPKRLLVSLSRRLFYASYLRHYTQLTGAPWQAIHAWQLPLAAARLNTEIPEERAQLLAVIGKRDTGNRKRDTVGRQ